MSVWTVGESRVLKIISCFIERQEYFNFVGIFRSLCADMCYSDYLTGHFTIYIFIHRGVDNAKWLITCSSANYEMFCVKVRLLMFLLYQRSTFQPKRSKFGTFIDFSWWQLNIFIFPPIRRVTLMYVCRDYLRRPYIVPKGRMFQNNFL